MELTDKFENLSLNTLVKDKPLNNNVIPKPIIKWVGGKTQIIDKIIAEFPVEIDTYYEIFLGGGSVLLALLSYAKHGIIKVNNVVAYDVNEPLIWMYKNIQTNYLELYDELQKLIDEFNEIDKNNINNIQVNRKPKNIEEAKQSRESYYYWIRSRYNNLLNKKTIKCSAMFIFLNKLCFRGLFRMGPNGFNVPYGHYTNPEIINLEHLKTISELIQNVQFYCMDFKQSLNFQSLNFQSLKFNKSGSDSISNNFKSNDFIYLDPPYLSENNKSFVNYIENGFNLEEHIKLFDIIHKLTEENIKLLLSNADVKLIHKQFDRYANATEFDNKKYNIQSILCKRTINSKKPNSMINEVLIKNY